MIQFKYTAEVVDSLSIYPYRDEAVSLDDIDETTIGSINGYKGKIVKDGQGMLMIRVGSTFFKRVTTYFVLVIESQQFIVNMNDIQVGETIDFYVHIETNLTTHYGIVYKLNTSNVFRTAITAPEPDFKNKTINGQQTKLFVTRYVDN